MMQRDDLEQLYDDHAEAIFRYLCTLVQSETDARDRLQDLFLKVARQPSCLEGITNQRAYLLRVAHNIAIDAARRNTTRKEKHGELAISPFASVADPDTHAMQQALTTALSELPERQRDVVYLKLFEELSFDAIASTFGISPNTAASRYRYGMEKLRHLLQPLYDDINEDS